MRGEGEIRTNSIPVSRKEGTGVKKELMNIEI